ncbi:MAG TPA: hypothetical protein VLA00_15820 [Xanthobacteraceae bacterium]|nr:hypothetical protein [Xanthobacteraceae bacterium]
MISSDPTPRPDLWTVKDEAAWLEQFFILRIVLGMTGTQIAQIDYGLDPGHPEAEFAAIWGNEIERTFPRCPKLCMRTRPTGGAK